MENEQKFCKECCREITKSEAESNKGFCTKCYLMRKKEYSNDNIANYSNDLKTNVVARIIKVIAIIGGFIGIIYGFNLLDSYHTEDIAFPIIIASIVSAIFVYALGEIIQLLEDIKNK